jgi:ferrous iron transport protein B
VKRLSSRKKAKVNGSCHGPAMAVTAGLPIMAIVGQPNVGKSILFNRLTGAYVTVSNYPGTTVEVANGHVQLPCCGGSLNVVDTPGMFDLMPTTEEERVTRRILLDERPGLILNVVDAKNMMRMLPLTLQLIEAGLPVILDLNMMDEAELHGLEIDLNALENALGIPVVSTIGTNGTGLEILKERISNSVHPDCAIRSCH